MLFCASGNRSASGAQTLKDIPQIQIPATRGVELSKKNNVYETIDGRVLVKAHGTADMPIWGRENMLKGPYERDPNPNFPEAFARAKILALTEYVYRLQAK